MGGTRTSTCKRRQCHVRTGRSNSMAQPSAGSNSIRDGRLRLVTKMDGPIEEIRPGDVVWFPAGEKHWHGASPTTGMTHIAIQEFLEGKAAEWMEKVSDEQYLAGK